MTNEWDEPAEEYRQQRRWTLLLLALIVAFGSGSAATLYILRHVEPVRRLAGFVPTSANIPQVTPAPRTLVVTPPIALPPATTELTRRLGRVEQGLSQLAERTTETSSNADRAEGLLVAFAARRALDRGTPLGYIEGLLRERFGGTQPQAVATILSASRQPVTLEELQTGLDAIASKLVVRNDGETWWNGVRRELSGLIVVRRASAPSIIPADRLTQARRQLEMGHVDLALAEVARLPGRTVAADWIVKARRYASARHALDMIETAALLAPHATVLTNPITTLTSSLPTPVRPDPDPAETAR